MLKIILLLILVSFVLPVFAQESVDSSNMSNITTTINASQNTFEVPITIWNIGIFAIIGSAITLIGILLTIRFIYIDKHHEKRIKRIRDDVEKEIESQEMLFDAEAFTKDNVRWFAEYISAFYVALEDVRQRRRKNSQEGVSIDIICMGFLFIFGAIGTTGFFEDQFTILIIIVGVLVFFPIIHFIVQLRRTRYDIEFSH